MPSRFRILALALLVTLCLTSSAPAQPVVHALDPFLPADTENYLTINIRQLLDSPMFKKLGLDAARDALKNADEINDVLKDLGLDPFKDVDRLTISGPSTPDTDRGLFILQGRFDAAKIEAKAKQIAKDMEDVLKIHNVPDGAGGTQVVWEATVQGAEQPIFVALVGKTTVLASPGKDYVVDAVKQGKSKKAPVLKNKEFQALLEKLDPKQSLSMAVMAKTFGKAPALNDAPAVLRDVVGKMEVIGASVRTDKDLEIELSVATKTDKDARELRETTDKGLKMALAGLAILGSDRKEVTVALELVKSTRVSAKGKVVTLKARISPDAIEEALKKDD